MINKIKVFLKSPTFYLLLILIIASFLRLYNLFNVPPGLYPDEAMNGNNALEALSTHHFKVFYPENNGREGLFMNIQAFFLWLFKTTEPWILRLPSALFGILTVLGVYFFTKELFSCKNTKKYESTKYKIALLSSFFVATNFWHINFSRIGFRAIMSPFFLVWGLYFLLKSFHSLNLKPYTLFAILAGIFYGLGFHSYIAYRTTPLLILIILIYFFIRSKKEGWQKKFLISSFCFIFFTIIAFLPLGIYFLKNPADFFGRTSQISIFNSSNPLKQLAINTIKTFGMFNFVGDSNWRHNISGKPELFWPVGILFIIGIIIGIYSIFKNPKDKTQTTNQTQNLSAKNSFISNFESDIRFSFLILFSWLIVAALPVVISNEGIPHALRSILMIPPVFIFAGVGGMWLYEMILTKIRNYTTMRNALIILFFIILIFEAYTSYFIVWAKNPEVAGAFNADWVRIGRELKATCGVGCDKLPKYVIVRAGGVDVRGIPMPAQTVMFITDTFTPEKQNAKNLHYVLPDQISQIPENALVVEIK
jgi:hypothetical protein